MSSMTRIPILSRLPRQNTLTSIASMARKTGVDRLIILRLASLVSIVELVFLVALVILSRLARFAKMAKIGTTNGKYDKTLKPVGRKMVKC